jgi:hypothetical protein
MKYYDCHIETYEIRPPLGTDRRTWGAKVAIIWERESRGGEGKRLGGLMTEHWGETEDEAEQKADAEFAEWVTSKGGERA